MLDWPAFGDALWTVSDELGIRPEWQLPVLGIESGGTLDPRAVNANGCVGLNQFCPGTLEQYVTVPAAEYRDWPASVQLAGPILEYWRDAVRYGPIRSGARLMLAQLGPALLASSPSLGSPVYAAPSSAYTQNRWLDPAGKGYFTVGDLADAVARASASPAVRQALALAYAMRPGEWTRDPGLGEDWPSPRRLAAPRLPALSPVVPLVATVVLVAVAGYAARERRRLV
jgi:hypothetical protein